MSFPFGGESPWASRAGLWSRSWSWQGDLGFHVQMMIRSPCVDSRLFKTRFLHVLAFKGHCTLDLITALQCSVRLASSILPRWAGSWCQEACRQDHAGSRRAEGTTADEQVALSSLGRGRGSTHRLVRKVKHGMTLCCPVLVVLVSRDCSLHHDAVLLAETNFARAQPVICMHHHEFFLATESHLPARDAGLRDPGCP